MVELRRYGDGNEDNDDQLMTATGRRSDPKGMTLWARTEDGRHLRWRQPLIEPTRRAYGTWGGDPALVNAADLFLRDDPDEDPLSLHSVAVALHYVAGARGEVDPITEVLEARHPRTELG